MTAHLTNEELTNRLLDEPSMTVEAHLLDCQACRAELNQMRSSVAGFRDAAHSWSDNAAPMNPSPIAVAPRGQKVWAAEWAVAAALLLVLLVLPVVYWQDRDLRSPTSSPNSPAEAFRNQVSQDNELLSAVNREIGEGVPAPMQPLRVSLSYGTSSPVNQAK